MKSLITRERPRIDALDSLRFLAAIVVVLTHTSNIVGFGFPRFFPLAGMLNAFSAVALFFVLSGYVLQRGWKNPLTIQSYAAFQVRRIFRLYPLHLVVLLFAAYLLLALPLGTSTLLNQSEYASETIKAHDHHDLRQWTNQIILIGGGIDPTFANPPIWTLSVEMRIALIFPFIATAMNAMRPRYSLLLTGVAFLTGHWLAQHTISTVGMIPLFLAGSLLARIESAYPRSTIPGWMLVLGGGVIYCCGSLEFLSNFGRFTQMYVAGVGSVCMMAGTLRSEAIQAALCKRWLLFGGRCSYGIYLFHFPLLLLAGWLITATEWSHGLLFPIVTSAAILLAWMTWHIVEKPFIRWGRTVSQILTKSHI